MRTLEIEIELELELPDLPLFCYHFETQKSDFWVTSGLRQTALDSVTIV